MQITNSYSFITQTLYKSGSVWNVRFQTTNYDQIPKKNPTTVSKARSQHANSNTLKAVMPQITGSFN